VSLILEALKKLDREKHAPDRGLLVVGPAAWPSAPDSRPGLGAVAAVALVLSGVGAAVWHFGGRPSSVVPHEMAPREVPPREAAAEPAPAPFGRTRAAASVPAAPSSAASTHEPVSASTPVAAAAAPRVVRGSVPQDAAATQRAAVAAPEPAPDAAARVKETKLGPGVYQLQAISAQDGHAVAILNDRLVREGDSFDGARVLRIGADEVEIEVAGRRRVVKF
jgi:hypothetical protein